MRSWWDRLLGRPAIEDLARRVAHALEARGSAPLAFDAAQRELRTAESPPRIYYLGNVWSDFARAPRQRRDEVVARFVEALAAVEEAMPARYEDARAHLMPVVRGAGEDELARLQARRSGASAEEVARFHPASKPLFGDLTVGVAYDTPHAIQRLSREQLVAWNVSLDTALADALDNLRSLDEVHGWVPLAPGVWSGQWGDDYESSRLLLPDLIHRLGVPDPVVLAPLRRLLLVTGAHNAEGLAAMAQAARDALQEQPRWLSVTPMRLTDAGWVPFEPPEPCAPAFAELAAIERAERYATQKAALDDLHAQDGTDVFVASLALYRAPDGHPCETTTWTRGVATWLPRADRIVLVDGDHVRDVAWATLIAAHPEALAPLGMQPERYRTGAFPDEAPNVRPRGPEPDAASRSEPLARSLP